MLELIRPIIEFKNPVVFTIPVFVLLIFFEVYINHRERTEYYTFKDSVASISMGLGSVFIDIITKSFAFAAFGWLYLNVGFFKTELSFTILGWGLLFFLDDFTFYWHHRMSH